MAGCALSREEEKEDASARGACLAGRTLGTSFDTAMEEEEEEEEDVGIAENVIALMSPSTLVNTALSWETVTGW